MAQVDQLSSEVVVFPDPKLDAAIDAALAKKPMDWHESNEITFNER